MADKQADGYTPSFSKQAKKTEGITDRV
jgi:hypothetical protein